MKHRILKNLHKKSGTCIPLFLFLAAKGDYPWVVEYPLGTSAKPLEIFPAVGADFCEYSFAGLASLLNFVQYFMFNPFWLSANSSYLQYNR